MKLKKALEPTGKACREDNFADYVMLVGNEGGFGSLLHWFNGGEDIGEVVFEEQIDDKWQPCFKEKKIMPEKKVEGWGKSAIQDDNYKLAQAYANKAAREALEFLDNLQKI